MAVFNLLEYIDRIIDEDLKRYLKIKGAVVLTGPKCYEKTVTAQQQGISVLKLYGIDKKEV
jgi:hypothetical protein